MAREGEGPTVIAPQPGPQTHFLSSFADVVFYGGAAGGGKTWGLLLEPLRHVGNAKFNGVIFRRTSPQITNPGGMWDESQKLYPMMRASWKVGNLSYSFPSGASMRFAHLQYEDTKYNWQGSQIAFIGFDELTHFTEGQFFYLLSRNRSMSGVRPYVRGTTNPDADSWVARFIAWWIDQETGYAIPERSGRVRYFTRKSGEVIWGDAPEEVAEKAGLDEALKYGGTLKDMVKSFTFIKSDVYDNKILLAQDPQYLANLLAQNNVERERLLGGNWKIRAEAGKVFNRAWFEILPAAPVCTNYVRYWDKAATADDGDWTVGVLMGERGGNFFVIDVIRGQYSTAQRENLIRQVAITDNQRYQRLTTWVEQEGGSGGKDSAVMTVQNLAGYTVRTERVARDKVSRAEPMSAQAEVGNVKVVVGEWNEAWLTEMHAFPTGANDDQVDASSGAFNRLALDFQAGVAGPLDDETAQAEDDDPLW